MRLPMIASSEAIRSRHARLLRQTPDDAQRVLQLRRTNVYCRLVFDTRAANGEMTQENVGIFIR